MGEWFYPNGTVVPIGGIPGSNVSIYRSRTGANINSVSLQEGATVRLNRKNNAVDPTGVYRCEIPDRDGVNRTLFVGVYVSINNSKLNL